MNAQPPELILEPERYELQAAPLYHFKFDRRRFFKVLGSGVVILFLVEAALAQESGNARRRGGRGGQRPMAISAWLHIGKDGTVTVFTGKAEVGQNIRTSLTQAVAEELRTSVDMIRVVMADTELTPFDAGTFGSRTTPDMAEQLHKVAAAARKALLDLAADHFKTDRPTLVVADGKISRTGTKDSATFGQITKGQKIVQPISDNSPTTPANEWKIAGTSVLKVNGRDFVTGKHKYTSDIKLAGMVYGKILRPAAFEATLASVDTKAAEAMESVTVVHDGNFIGVTAPNFLLASQAIDAIRAEWTTKPQPSSAVLEAAAKAFGWGTVKSSEGHGFGIAAGTEKGSYVATCAEVLADRKTGSVNVVRAVSAFECGAVVNPDQLKNQIEGAMVMGLGGGLFEVIEFENGRIKNPHLADYRVPRFSDAPRIEVVLVNRKDLPSAGAGETPIVAIAPAVGNAIFAASGIRLRSMPMVPDGLKA